MPSFKGKGNRNRAEGQPGQVRTWTSAAKSKLDKLDKLAHQTARHLTMGHYHNKGRMTSSHQAIKCITHLGLKFPISFSSFIFLGLPTVGRFVFAVSVSASVDIDPVADVDGGLERHGGERHWANWHCSSHSSRSKFKRVQHLRLRAQPSVLHVCRKTTATRNRGASASWRKAGVNESVNNASNTRWCLPGSAPKNPPI